MEQNVISIRHKCGAILAIPYAPGIENKKVTCPVCHKSDYVRDCTPYNGNAAGQQGGQQPFNPQQSAGQQGGKNEETDLDEKTQMVLGHLIVMNGNAKPYRHDLKLGRNVIGRKSSVQDIDLPIDTGTNKHISRKHLAIDVVAKAGSAPVFRVMLMKKEVNETRVNNMQLQYGDCILLKNGSCIQLPDGVRLQFVQDYNGGAPQQHGCNGEQGTEYSEYE